MESSLWFALASERRIKAVFVPAVDAAEATLVRRCIVYPVETLGQLVAHLNKERQIEPINAIFRLLDNINEAVYLQDMSSVRGQEHVKRAFEGCC